MNYVAQIIITTVFLGQQPEALLHSQVILTTFYKTKKPTKGMFFMYMPSILWGTLSLHFL